MGIEIFSRISSKNQLTYNFCKQTEMLKMTIENKNPQNEKCFKKEFTFLVRFLIKLKFKRICKLHFSKKYMPIFVPTFHFRAQSFYLLKPMEQTFIFEANIPK